MKKQVRSDRRSVLNALDLEQVRGGGKAKNFLVPSGTPAPDNETPAF